MSRLDLSVDPAVFARFPGYRAGVLVAEGVSNGPSDAASDAILREAEARAAQQPPHLAAEQPHLAAEQPHLAADHPHLAADHPYLAAWRDAFRAFGAKRHLCSAEALIQRALSGDRLPRISALVDRYNAVSVLHSVPVGGEDLDHVVPPVRLSFATGDERFDEGGVRAGEVVWADAVGVTCRRWNWRQGVRTRLSPSTTRAYFLFDALPPFSDAELLAAMSDLRASLAAGWPSARISSWVVDQRTAAG